MLRKEQNDLLTQTGPGTPAGRLFRSYWLPVLLTEELPANDCPPVRVKLLSERLLAFRDSDGRLGLIDEFCAHRGVSLWFGRNEESGLRCPYHGWKYDVTGQCIEVPSEPEESGYCQKIKLTAYPLVERGGVLWTYMGPKEQTPPLPEWEFAMVPDRHRFVVQAHPGIAIGCKPWRAASIPAMCRSCTAAISIPIRCSGAPRATSTTWRTRGPVFEVVESAGGLFIGARRNAENDHYYWRITQWVMPSFTMIAPRGDHSVHGHFWIPIDDDNCWTWSFDYHPIRELKDGRSRRHAGRQKHLRQIRAGHVPAARQQGQRLSDGPRRAEGGAHL